LVLAIVGGWLPGVDSWGIGSTQVAAAQLAGGKSIRWANSVEQAVAQASAENKLVLLHFGADYCGPCRSVEQFVFTEPQVAEAIHQQFVPVKIDIQKSPELAEKFEVTRIPQDVIITSEGLVAYRRTSPSRAGEYRNMLAAGARMAAQTSVQSQQVVERMSGITQRQRDDAQRSPFLGTEAAKAGSLALGTPAQQGLTRRDSLVTAATVQNSAAVAPATFSANESTSAEFPGHQLAPAQFPQANFQTPRGLPEINNPFVNNPGPMTTAHYVESTDRGAPLATQKVPTAVAEEVGVQQVSATVAPELGPVGLEGYCPVTLLNNQRWSKGDAQFGCYHRGVLYLFADQASQERFLQSPDAHSPLLGGFDPVIMETEQRLQPGKRRFGVFCETMPGQNAIVLFATEENRDRFKQDSERYLQLIRDITAKADRS
jgi:protein disulfide-isomerase